MNVRIVLGVFSAFLTAFLVGCEQSPAGPDAGLPPDIKVGAKVSFNQPGYPIRFPGFYETPQVEEVRGTWVRMKWVVNAEGKQFGVTKQADSHTYWVNFATVTSIEVAP